MWLSVLLLISTTSCQNWENMMGFEMIYSYSQVGTPLQITPFTSKWAALSLPSCASSMMPVLCELRDFLYSKYLGLCLLCHQQRGKTTSQHLATPRNTPQHLATPHNTSHYLTTPHNTSQHRTTPHNTSQHLATPRNTSQHLTTPHNTSQHLTTPHNT